MKQYNTILKAMFENKDKESWKATDFMQGEYFVGYEASARMSELAKLHSDILIVGKEGRYRTLSVNWEKEKEIFEIYDLIQKENEKNERVKRAL